MVRAQKRGMGKMRRQDNDRSERHTSVARGPRAFCACPIAEISRKGHNPNRESWTIKGGREEGDKGRARRRDDGGGGDKDGGTLVIGSLATAGWVDVINGNCTCSREPLMALNLHQAWTGGWRRKSQGQKQPASHYTLNLYIMLSHTYSRVQSTVVTPRTPGLSSQHVIFHSLALFHFISNALHFRPFHSELPPAMQNVGWNTSSQHRTHSNLWIQWVAWPQWGCPQP